MHYPLIINSDGFNCVTKKPIRIGEATQPYHAVTLAQVKRLLQSPGTSGGSPFVTDSMGRFSDSVIAFILSEIGWEETLDYVYTGRVGSSIAWSDKAKLPMAVFVLADTITWVADLAGFTLSEVGWGEEELDYVYTGQVADNIISNTVLITLPVISVTDFIAIVDTSIAYTLSDALGDEVFEYVYTGHIVDNLAINVAILPQPSVITTEYVPFLDLPTPYTLADAMGNEMGDYIYTGKGYEPIDVTEFFPVPELIYAIDTITTTEVDTGDLIYENMPLPDDDYPFDGFVIQKTKPEPMGEAKTMSDGAYGFIEPNPNL